MDKIRKAFGLVGATIIASAAAASIGAGTAGAVAVDQYDNVRQWICSETNASVNLDYINSYGNITSVRDTYLVGQRSQDGSVTCIYKDLQAEGYGDYISTTILDESGGFVSCAIFVNGVKVSESEDNSEYFSFASCY